MNSTNFLSNFIWRFAERCGAQLVLFVVSIVLARILTPEAYGVVALITVFTSILQVFVDSGLGNALIQKKNADELDFSSVFYANIAFCGILYLLLYECAPWIAAFYDDVSMTSMIRVLGITVIVSGVKNVQQAYVSRNMIFRKFFFSTLGGTITAAVVGITMALSGYGVWALVAQQIINVTIDTVILWISVRWRPQWIFSWRRLCLLFSFGWKLLVSALLDISYSNIRQLIIGKMYSSADLAYYNQGRKFPNLIVTNINSSIDSVLFPTLSQAQDDRGKLRAMTRRAIKTSTYIMAPLMIGLAFTAEPVVQLVLTDKWLECVPYLRIFCICYMFYPVHTANLNALNAMGRSDLFLKLEVWKKCVGLVLLLSTMWFGPMAMAYSMLVSSVLSQMINSWPNKRLLDYSYRKQLKDILPGIAIAVIMGAAVYPLCYLHIPVILILAIQVAAGLAIYIGLSVIFRIDSFIYILDLIRPLFKRKEEQQP